MKITAKNIILGKTGQKKRRSLVSALGSLGRRGRGEKPEYTESASRYLYLGEVYREYHSRYLMQVPGRGVPGVCGRHGDYGDKEVGVHVQGVNKISIEFLFKNYCWSF